MELSIRNPPPTTAEAAPCHDTGEADEPLAAATLASGETYETDLVWTASFVRDLVKPVTLMRPKGSLAETR